MDKINIFLIFLIFNFCLNTRQKRKEITQEEFNKMMGVPQVKLERKLIEESPYISFKDIISQKDSNIGSSEDSSGDSSSKKEESQKLINIKCLWANKYNVYSLQELQNKEKDYEKDFDSGKIIFNLCQNTITKVDEEESDSTVLWDNGNETIKIAGSINGDGENKNVWSELGNDDNQSGLVIRLVEGDICEGNEKHQTTLKIYCDPEVDEDNFLDSINLDYFSNETCIHVIEARSIYGCTLNSIYLLKRIFDEYKIPFSILFIIIGIFLCLWGYKYLNITVMLVSSIIGSYLVTVAVLNFFPSTITSETRLWITLAIGFFVGLVMGFFLKNDVQGFVIMQAGILGYSVGTFAYQIVQEYIEWDPTYLYYATLAVCTVIGLLLGLCMYKVILTLGTAVFGGYLAMRGVSFIVGNYVDENQIIDLIKNQEFEQLKEIRGPWVYGYLGSWLALSLIGLFIQCKHTKKNRRK